MTRTKTNTSFFRKGVTNYANLRVLHGLRDRSWVIIQEEESNLPWPKSRPLPEKERVYEAKIKSLDADFVYMRFIEGQNNQLSRDGKLLIFFLCSLSSLG